MLIRYGLYLKKYENENLFGKHLDLMIEELFKKNPKIIKYPILLNQSDFEIDGKKINTVLEPHQARERKNSWKIVFLSFTVYIRVSLCLLNDNVNSLQNNKLILGKNNDILMIPILKNIKNTKDLT
jgi:hypothetical protein